MRLLTFEHEFVTYIPEDLDEGRLYISMVHATVAHRCCCGCGNEVFTPLSPRDWSLTFDGDTVSLDPSIGNWSFACQSHYWIDHSQVRWAGRWSRREIEAGASGIGKSRRRTPGRLGHLKTLQEMGRHTYNLVLLSGSAI